MIASSPLRLLLPAIGLSVSVGAVPAPAQTPPDASTKTLRALRMTSPIQLDGRLDEVVWARAEVISDFVQQEPRVGEPITERTEVRVLVDEEAIYFGVRCYDSEPSGIVARELRRDNPLTNDDRFEVVLDTFHDHRNAFHLAINPLGTRYDALITDEGQDVNVEWNERWGAETTIDETGWTAEIRVPLTTLRSHTGVDAFGVNFLRFIRRKNETALWSGWHRNFTFLQVSQAGHLSGLEGIRTGLRLRIKPYGLTGFRDGAPGGPSGLDLLKEVGLETVKMSLTPGLTAEVTANPDFAQVEVDEAVLNLTRFPLFFPEKREFFLERAGLFEFGQGGRRGFPAERDLQMFFSRRIGLTADRRPVPILAGGKVTGRAAGVDIGLLNVQTDRFEGVAGSNYAVLRAKRNILSRSTVGLFASNRQASGDDYNRVLAADLNFTVGNTDVKGFFGRSMTPGLQGDDTVGLIKYDWMTDTYQVFLEHLHIGEDFQHDVGFVRRQGIERTNPAVIWEPRPDRFNIWFLVFRGELVYIADPDRTLLARDQIFQATSRFRSDDALRLNITDTFDRLEAPFEIAEGIVLPPGDYNFRETWAEGEASGKRGLGGRIRLATGTFYSGRRQYVRVTPVWRPSPLLSLEPAYEWNDVELREGRFTTHVANVRLNVNFTNQWLTTGLAQYDSASGRREFYVRLNYIFRPGDDLFVVYNHSSSERAAERSGHSLLVKVTYSMDF